MSKGYLTVDRKYAFIRHPLIRGWWLKTKPVALTRSCPYCGVDPGLPCWGSNGRYISEVHVARHLKKKK
jgi:hypothetical protein